MTETMSNREPNMDEQIVGHMNELNRLVEQDIRWIEEQVHLNDYSIHVSNLESNLQMHAERILAFRERVIRQIALKRGRDGQDIYGKELANIRIRGFFSKACQVLSIQARPILNSNQRPRFQPNPGTRRVTGSAN